MPIKQGFSEVERNALRLLSEGYEVRNAQGPVRANSYLMRGEERVMLGRGTMARLRDLGLIAYVQGQAALARITERGKRVSASLEGTCQQT